MFGKFTPDTQVIEVSVARPFDLAVEVVNYGGDLETYALELRSTESTLSCDLPLELSVGAGDTSTVKVRLLLAKQDAPSKSQAELVLVLGGHIVDRRKFDVLVQLEDEGATPQVSRRRKAKSVQSSSPVLETDGALHQEATDDETERKDESDFVASTPSEVEQRHLGVTEASPVLESEPVLEAQAAEIGSSDGGLEPQTRTIVTRKEPKKAARPKEEPANPTEFVVQGGQAYEEPAPAKPSRIRDEEKNVVANPVDGQNVSMAPNSRKVFTFDFKNGPGNAADYFLNVDAAGLPDASWIVPLRPQVRVEPNDENDLGFCIVLPEARLAPPGRYELAVTYGSQQSTQHDEILLYLTVEPELAIRVTCETPQISVGPLGRVAKGEVLVSNQGNASTAYRLAVSDNSVESELQPIDASSGGTWDYTVDWELSDSNYQKDAKSRVHGLTVRRKGIWWFGFKESRKVAIAAQPVTAPAGRNLSKTQIDVSFWRLLPVSWLIWVPLVALALLWPRSSMPSPVKLYLKGDLSRAKEFVDKRWLVLQAYGAKESPVRVASEPVVPLEVSRMVDEGTRGSDWEDTDTSTAASVLKGKYVERATYRPKHLAGGNTLELLTLKGDSYVGPARRWSMFDFALSNEDKKGFVKVEPASDSETFRLDGVNHEWREGFGIDFEDNSDSNLPKPGDDLALQISIKIPASLLDKGKRVRCYLTITNPFNSASLAIYLSPASSGMMKLSLAGWNEREGVLKVVSKGANLPIEFDLPGNFSEPIEWRFYTGDPSTRCVILRYERAK